MDVDERLAHTRRMLLIDAEHDGFLEAVAALFKKLDHLPTCQLRPVVEDQRPVKKSPSVVDPVLDFIALAIKLSLSGR